MYYIKYFNYFYTKLNFTKMEKNKMLPTILGYVLGLAGLYIAVRVASTAWRGGQK